MKLSRRKAKEILSHFDRSEYGFDFSKVTFEESANAIDTAIQCMGETKLIDEAHEYSNLIIHIHKTECCKIGPITTEKFCPECGKKIIK